MKLLEYESKELFRAHRIPVPPSGGVIRALAQLPAALRRAGRGPWVIKAQVLAGGRGKAGGIKLARTPAEARAAAGEEEHDLLVGGIQETRGVGGQDDDRPRGPVTDQADARPEVQGTADAIAAFREENDALTGGFLDPINGLLKRGGVVASASRAGDIDGLGVLQPSRVIRGRPGRRHNGEPDQNQSQPP